MMTLTKLLMGLCIITYVDSALAGKEKNSPECQLVAGYDEAKPFHYTNGQERVIGMDADILREVLTSIDCQIEFRELPWSRTLAWVEDGEVDIAIGASYKNARAEWAYYSVAYKFINHELYTRAGEYDEISSIGSFYDSKLKLGVVVGWGYPPEIRRALDKDTNIALTTEVTTFEQLPKMLDAGHVDGIIAIPKMLRSNVKENKYTQQFSSRANYKEELYYMFSKKSVSPKVVVKFNNALYKLISSGRREDIQFMYE